MNYENKPVKGAVFLEKIYKSYPNMGIEKMSKYDILSEIKFSFSCRNF